MLSIAALVIAIVTVTLVVYYVVFNKSKRSASPTNAPVPVPTFDPRPDPFDSDRLSVVIVAKDNASSINNIDNIPPGLLKFLNDVENNNLKSGSGKKLSFYVVSMVMKNSDNTGVMNLFQSRNDETLKNFGDYVFKGAEMSNGYTFNVNYKNFYDKYDGKGELPLVFIGDTNKFARYIASNVYTNKDTWSLHDVTNIFTNANGIYKSHIANDLSYNDYINAIRKL
jgi:hypothetical protein